MQKSPPPPGSSQTSNLIRRSYRNPVPVPAQILHNASICIREHLHANAFSLLSSVLVAGTGTELPAAVPPASYLAFAGTLIIHPGHTTRTRLAEKQAASDEALRYLRHVVSLVGAVNAGFNRAFVFSEKEDERRTKRKETRKSGFVVIEEDEDRVSQLQVPLAARQSVWQNAGDFWAIVGWAFNCSVKCKHRWGRWRLWLELMCDILESDLDERAAQANDLWVENEERAGKLLRDSMMAQYLSGLSSGRGSKRRIVRAILADGGQQNMAEFPELWKNETDSPKAQPTHEEEEAAKKKRKLDLDHGDYGDYFDHDDSSSERDTPDATLKRSTRLSSCKRRRPSTHSDNESDTTSNSPDQITTKSTSTTPPKPTTPSHGGPQSLHLRRRLLRLLALYSTLLSSPSSPAHFTDTETLFEIYVEALRDLPLQTFTAFALPTSIPNATSPFPAYNTCAPDLSAPWLEPEALSSLLQVLVRPLLSAQAPLYHLNSLTPADWCKYFAPWAANLGSVVENARVSICVEGLGRLLWRMDRRAWEGLKGEEEGLGRVVEEGIKARRKKAGLKVGGKEREARRGWGGRLGKKEDEEAAVRVLEGSERRLRALVGL
ncbi:hypothetical protein MBLNU230_g3960t1 [Neophaeotheca triangularis]